MTSREDLKNMIMQFRVVELQTLLEFAGYKNVKLRKRDLLKKALYLIAKKKTLALAHQIHNIHLQMNSKRKQDSTIKYRSSLDFLYNDYFGNAKDPNSYSDHSGKLDSSSQLNPYFSLFKKLDMARLTSIKFANLSFFEYLSDIMLVTPLMPVREKNDLFEYNGTFTLSEKIIEHFLYENETNSQYQVLLRMCLLNDETDVVDCLPPKLYVTVNDKYCALPPPDPSVSKQNPVVKRISAPINITGYLNRDLFINTLVVHWAAQFYTCYGLTVQFVKRRRADELVQKLKERGEQDPSVSKKIIYDSLNDDDNEVAATSLKMSLICPLGKMLMSLPTRGSTCNHLQCFDGCLYIKMNEIKSMWQCPVCNQTCTFENLFVDGYFMDILRSDKFTPEVTDIRLNADGSWESVAPTNVRRSHNACSKVPATTVRDDIAVIEDLSKKRLDSASKAESNPRKRLKKMIRVDETKTVETSHEASPLINDESIVDDLRHFLFPYDNVDVSEGSLRRALLNDPTLDFLPGANNSSAFDMTATTVAQSSPSPSVSSSASSNKKTVVLVDLTGSDSESDDIRSTSSSSTYSNRSFLRIRDDFTIDSSPPVYEIDSDSS